MTRSCLLLLALLVSACGQTGALVLPQESAPPAVVAPASVPVSGPDRENPPKTPEEGPK